MADVKNTEALDRLLSKQAGFFDVLKPPEIPRFFAPQPLGMAKKKDDLRRTQKKEIELWHKWDQNGRKPEDLQEIHRSFKPLINKKVSVYAGRVPIPTSAIRHEMNKHFITAVKTYNPTKGAQLNTWVQQNLKKSRRFINNYQNMGKIPEGQISLIPKYDQAFDELTDELGHIPDARLIADRMGEPLNKVKQLEKERRADLSSSGFQSDPSEVLAPKELEALSIIQYDLTPEERTVYEHTFGMNGKKMMKPGEIAKATGMHVSKVSRLRNKLKDKVTEAMEVL